MPNGVLPEFRQASCHDRDGSVLSTRVYLHPMGSVCYFSSFENRIEEIEQEQYLHSEHDHRNRTDKRFRSRTV
jgi:hypothetical protein